MDGIKRPQFKTVDWSEIDRHDIDLVKSTDIMQDFMNALHCEMRRFIYEPKNDQTMQRMGECISDGISRAFPDAFVHKVDIDDMRDLEGKYSECRTCAETNSYEEYKFKRAIQNLPDEAGSEREWFRMSRYSPNSVLLNVSFRPADVIQDVEITTKVF